MNNIEQAIKKQRQILRQKLQQPLAELAQSLARHLDNRKQIEHLLTQNCFVLNQCKSAYVLDHNYIQLTANLSKEGKDKAQLGRDRSLRPYMQYDFNESDFYLSEAYISKNRHRPSITAVHCIRDDKQHIIGYLGLDFDLRELPGTSEAFKSQNSWQQIKGDPAIRSHLFSQQRIQSIMDNNLSNVFALMQELMCEHGIFHGKFHFSSSRTTIWLVDDPYVYHILTIKELNDPDICLVYPKRPYFEKNIVPQADIPKIFEQFRQLRFADETIYLRSGSLNLVNGMIGLNFSCDGSHYLPYREFLDKGLSFWFGRHIDVDQIVELICQKGCESVYQDIERLQTGGNPEGLEQLSLEERRLVLQELVSIMQVYQT